MDNPYIETTLGYACQHFPKVSCINMVKIYAIIDNYDPINNLLKLFDDTRDDFEVLLCNGKRTILKNDENFKEVEELEIKVGDIIRIDDLLLCHDFTARCIGNKNIVIYNSSSEICDFFSARKKNLLFTKTVKENVIALQAFLIERVIKKPVINRMDSSTDASIIDIAFELLHMKVNDNSLFLVGWSGNPPDEKSLNLVSLEEIAYTVSHRQMNDLKLDETTLVSLYENHRLINITVHGDFMRIAQIIQPFDYLVAFKVVRRPSDYAFDCHSHTLFIDPQSSVPLRLFEKRSLVGLEISKQIRKFLKNSNPQDSREESSNVDSEKLRLTLEFIDDCEHELFTRKDKTYLKNFFERKHEIVSKIDESFIRVKNFIELENNQFTNNYVIKANFEAFLNEIPFSNRKIFDNIDELRKYGTVVNCLNCLFERPFIKFCDQDIDNNEARFICPNCEKKDDCKLLISIKFMLKDLSGKENLVYFYGDFVNDLFDVEINPELYDVHSKIPDKLKILFKFLTHLSRDNNCNVTLDWKIIRFSTRDHTFYKIFDFDLNI